MRKAEQQKLEFKNNQERWFAQIVGFFYLESIFEPVIGSSSNTQSSSTTRELEHKPCRYALPFVALNETKPFFFDLKSGPNVMIELVKSLEQIAKCIYDVNNKKFFQVNHQ